MRDDICRAIRAWYEIKQDPSKDYLDVAAKQSHIDRLLDEEVKHLEAISPATIDERARIKKAIGEIETISRDWYYAKRNDPSILGIFLTNLEHELAEARQERDALVAEVEGLRAEVGAKPDARNLKTFQAIIAALVCGDGDANKLQDRNLVGKITKAIGLLGVKRSDDAVRQALKQTINFIEEERK